MRNIIAKLTVITLAIIFFAGCENTIIQPNADGIFAFNIGSLEFTYTPGSRTGTMVIHNPTTIWTCGNIKKADGNVGRDGEDFCVGDRRNRSTYTYDESYAWGEELRIEIHRDGITTVNYIILGSGPNGSGKIVVIVNECDETCNDYYPGDQGSLVEWFNSQNWDSYYTASTMVGKANIIIKTDDNELINATNLNTSVNNVEVFK